MLKVGTSLFLCISWRYWYSQTVQNWFVCYFFVKFVFFFDQNSLFRQNVSAFSKNLFWEKLESACLAVHKGENFQGLSRSRRVHVRQNMTFTKKRFFVLPSGNPCSVMKKQLADAQKVFSWQFFLILNTLRAFWYSQIEKLTKVNSTLTADGRCVFSSDGMNFH